MRRGKMIKREEEIEGRMVRSEKKGEKERGGLKEDWERGEDGKKEK